MTAPRKPGVTHATFNWHVERRSWKRSLQRLCEIVAMSKQPGGVARAIERMRAGDRAVDLHRASIG